MALQKTNLFCTKQNNIANTTFDLPKYTCNNSVKTKITFRKILAAQPLVTQPFRYCSFNHYRNLLLWDLMCLQTTKQTVQINFSELTRNPQTQHQPVSMQNNTIRTQFSRYNNIGDMHNPPAWSIGRIQSSKTATLLNNHKSMHLSVLFHHKNGKITIKTECLQTNNNKIVVENTPSLQLSISIKQSSVDHEYDYIQCIQQKHQQFNRR